MAAWVGYSPSESISDVFTGVVPSLSSESLLTALQGGGGSTLAGAEKILLRAAMAAVLNSSNGGVNYPLTTAEIITMTNNALATHNRNQILTLAAELDALNNLGCPLN